MLANTIGQDLCITGIDWPRAKLAILRALQTLECFGVVGAAHLPPAHL